MRKKHKRQLFFLAAGAIAGASAWWLIGCKTGCPIWGSPVWLTAWGAAFGAILGWTPGSGDL